MTEVSVTQIKEIRAAVWVLLQKFLVRSLAWEFCLLP